MHANVHSDRGGGGGGGSWRLPPDETLQVKDPKEKVDVSELPFKHEITHLVERVIFSPIALNVNLNSLYFSSRTLITMKHIIGKA